MAINKRYKGNTLPEVMIALSIISFCATLAVMIYINIQKSTTPFIRIKANEIAMKYMNETLHERTYSDEMFTEEEYYVKKTISRSDDFPDCTYIKISVFDQSNKKLSQLVSAVHAE